MGGLRDRSRPSTTTVNSIRKGAFKIWTQAELEEQRMRTRLDGPYESYFEDGRLWTKGIFEDGAECGAWFEDGENVTHPACVRS